MSGTNKIPSIATFASDNPSHFCNSDINGAVSRIIHGIAQSEDLILLELLKQIVVIEQTTQLGEDELSRKYLCIDGKRRAVIVTKKIDNGTKVLTNGRLLD